MYSLLKDDIKTGCVIPSIVLAIFPTDKEDTEDFNVTNLLQIRTAGKNLLILDGLQRTYTIFDLLSEVQSDPEIYSKVKSLPLRIEVYSGISKVGVLYRMLTLNTGQNPMSTRHQVEMLYSDYKTGFDGLVFITEAQDRVPSGNNEFRFSDILDGFLSYITGDYLPIEREDLVNTIKNLETLTKDDKKKDLFKHLIKTYNSLREHLDSQSISWQFDDAISLKKRAFARSVNELFSKVQTMAGFGAALHFLIENELINDLGEINNLIPTILGHNIKDSLNIMITHLDDIQVSAKKIGNEQRMYFYYFIRSLFNKSNEGYLDVEKAVSQANKFYKANMLG
ncbi:MAG: hypothetical protein EPO24_08480 [Bacteroidetes bacterium]|nr:MAG: hypothetical protein EPO24_08480 [Bacteroidota bacterium]